MIEPRNRIRRETRQGSFSLCAVDLFVFVSPGTLPVLYLHPWENRSVNILALGVHMHLAIGGSWQAHFILEPPQGEPKLQDDAAQLKALLADEPTTGLDPRCVWFLKSGFLQGKMAMDNQEHGVAMSKQCNYINFIYIYTWENQSPKNSSGQRKNLRYFRKKKENLGFRLKTSGIDFEPVLPTTQVVAKSQTSWN